MMKQLFRAAILVFLVTLFLSAWSLPAGAASKGTATNGLVNQGLSSLNASGKGNLAASPNPRGVGEFDAVAAVSANDVWAVGDGIGTLIEHWNGTLWSLVKSASPGTDFNNLYGVAAISANNVWAVGSYSDNPQLPNVETLIEHWNGRQWSVVSSPSPGTQSNQLNSVVALSATNVWAVGSSDFKTLVEHWNGTQWSVVSSPSPNNDAFLNGVTAISATNVWAVGYYFTSGSSQSGGGSQTLTEQWNGSQWSVISSPNSASQNNDLTGIAAVSGNANDIWAVGNSSGTNGFQTLIEQWNGTRWSIVASPNPGSSGNSLNAVVAVSANDVWAVGSSSNSSGVQQTLIEQWNGTKWSVVSSPSPGTLENELTGVTAVSASNMWAVGFHDGNNTVQTLIEQWNGSQWSVVSSPNAATGGSFLNGVATASANNVWAVGTSGVTNGYYQTLIEQWNGSKWSIVTSNNPGSVGNILNSVAVVSASNAWAVGEYSSTNYSSHSLIENWNGSAWSVVPSPNVVTHPTSRN